MKICFVVEGYPVPEDPFMPFIQQLVVEMARQGILCSIIAPQSLTRALKHHVPIRPSYWKDKQKDVEIDVYQPLYFSFSSKLGKLNRWLLYRACLNSYKTIRNDCEILYAHFWHMGMVAATIDESKPLFIACGESKISVLEKYNEKDVIEKLTRRDGVIYVGTKSRNESVSLGLQKEQPYIIAPNGYDPEVFRLLDKNVCRNKLGWNEKDFIVIFVGSFTQRKGINRLCSALTELKKRGIDCKACFIGEGEILPNYSDTLYCGKVSHSRIAEYLNAADIFVLPTDNEGCCNAIIEALACGLPIISSNQSFNDDILNDYNSIRVNPHSIKDIADAIQELYQNIPQREKLQEGALKFSRQLTISERAKKIIRFIEDHI